MHFNIRWPKILALGLQFILFALLAYFVFRNSTAETTFAGNDGATDLIIARLIDSGEPVLLGPPSHIGGRHPGPLYYWYVYVHAKIAGFDPVGTSVLMRVTKLFGVAILWWLCGALVPLRQRTATRVALLYAFLCIHYVTTLRVHWQSNFLILSSAIALLGLYLFFKHGARHFASALLGLSILFQSHLSSSPVIAGFGAVALIYAFRERRNFNVRLLVQRDVVFALVLLFFLWLPVIVHEIKYPSNFLGVAAVHSGGKGAGSDAGLQAALELAGRFFITYAWAGTTELWNKTLPAYILLFLAVTALGILFYRAESAARWMIGATLAALTVSIAALAEFRAPLYFHYLNSSIAIPVFLTALILGQSWALVRERPTGMLSLLGGLVLLITIVAFPRLLDQYKVPAHPKKSFHFHSVAHSGELAELIRARSTQPERTRVFTFLASKHVKNSYYFYLNSALHSKMEYSTFFHEMPSFRKNRPATSAFAVFCPASFRRERRRYIATLKGWRERQETVGPKCFGCEECVITELERKKIRGSSAKKTSGRSRHL